MYVYTSVCVSTETHFICSLLEDNQWQSLLVIITSTSFLWGIFVVTCSKVKQPSLFVLLYCLNCLIMNF